MVLLKGALRRFDSGNTLMDALKRHSDVITAAHSSVRFAFLAVAADKSN